MEKGSGGLASTKNRSLPAINEHALDRIEVTPRHTIIPADGHAVLDLGTDMSLRANVCAAMWNMKLIADCAPEGKGEAWDAPGLHDVAVPFFMDARGVPSTRFSDQAKADCQVLRETLIRVTYPAD